jgi:hypothetical protein
MKYPRLFAVLFVVLASMSLALGAEVLPEKPVTGDVKPAALGWLKDVETYKRLVTDLASDPMEGRGPGTLGLDKARDYLVNEFKRLGFTPAFRDEHGQASFIQPFEISAGIHAKEQSLVVLGKDGKAALSPKAGEHFGPRGFSGDGEVTAPLVFVGYGAVDKERKYDSYAGLAKDELKGKIVVAYRFEPVDADGLPTLMATPRKGAWGEASSLVNKAKWAADHGAAALLVVDPPSQDKEGAIASVAQTQGPAASIPVIQMAPEVFRFMLREAGLGDESVARQWERDANDNHTRIKQLDPLKATVKVKMERKKATIHNIGAVLPGAGSLKDEYLVIGGHYDHLGFGDAGSLSRSNKAEIHHGADDNASGTAGVVLTAMRFAEHAKAKDAPANRRSILFVLFSGEERGLLGSAHMLRKPEELGIKLEQMVAMLNMDMTGRMEGNKLIASGSGSGDKFEAMIQAAAKDLNIHIASDGGMGIGGSDHQSFHAKSIPAVHFFTGIHVDYHKPSDTADKINSEGGTKTVDLVCKIAQQLWGSQDKIAFQKVRVTHAASGGPRGGGAFLGIVPNYASIDADDGCVIDGTSAGSPAEAAGLKGDDVITAWDKKPVKNLRDLTAMIGESKPGQEITMKVIRAKKEVEIKVKLGTR